MKNKNKNLKNPKIFIQSIEKIPDPKLEPKLLENIPDWRNEYILKYKKSEDRKRSLGAWKLLTIELNEFGFDPSLVSVNSNGKLEHPDIHFSLSHSDKLILLVLNENPVGCDIEKIETFPIDISSRFFSSIEKKNYLFQVNKNDYLYQLWTGKESFLKMTGKGLINHLNQISIDPENRKVYKNGDLQNINLWNGKFQNYSWSVCFKKIPQ